MAEFSAHRVTVPEPADNRVTISTHVNLYVSTLGDDVLNSGIEEGSPFRTPARAIAWLGDKIITETGFVTVNFKGGIYDITQELVLDHDQGDRVAFVGADPEILLLQSIPYYETTDISGVAPSFGGETAFYKFYSATKHGITMNCVRTDDNTGFVGITSSINPIPPSRGFSGAGVLVEDYDLVFDDDYNPLYYYASYPYHPRNNISRMGSVLGAHILNGVITGGQLSVESTIRDSWICLPHSITGTGGGDVTQTTLNVPWGRWYGNSMSRLKFGLPVSPQGGGVYDLNFGTDASEELVNATIADDYPSLTNRSRGFYLSSVPLGYFGLTATTGIPVGGTANFIGATFPTGNDLGKTATYIYEGITQSGITGWFTATGEVSSILNDTILFGANYHEHTRFAPRGYSNILSLGSINTNRVTVKLVPTVFRRFGNILKISGAGMRKIKNIFFDGVDMLSHYKLLGNSETAASNKVAVYAVNCRLGVEMANEPAGLGSGFFSNSGAKDFHVGFMADRGSDATLGKFIVSNCSYGVIANNQSSVNTVGSVCTGSAATAFAAMNSSSLIADRCFASFCGQSLVSLRIKATSGLTLTDSSFIPGQTYETYETATYAGRIRGTVWDWDPRDKTLVIAVRAGFYEGVNPYLQPILNGNPLR